MRFQVELDEMYEAAQRVIWPPRRALPIDPLSHAAQAIHGASGDLLDLALVATRADALRMQPIVHGLLERLTAVDELVTRQLNREL